MLVERCSKNSSGISFCNCLSTNHNDVPCNQGHTTSIHDLILENSKKIIKNSPDTINGKEWHTQCYAHKKNMEESKMSLVGIMKNKHGIVAFGDEKSTDLVHGIPFKGEPEKVKKVYRGGNFLFVTYGYNTVLFPQSRPLQKFIEDIEPLKYDDYQMFFQALWESLFKTGILFAQQFDFIVGFPDTTVFNGERIGDYAIYSCILNRYQPNFIPESFDDTICTAGEQNFLPRSLEIRGDWSLKEMEMYARKLVETSIFFSEMICKENSVIGGKAVIESFADSTLFSS